MRLEVQEKMAKNKKIESYGKLPLSSLLDIDREVLTIEEREALEAEIDTREPFGYIDSQLSELLEKIENLEIDFKRHDHKDSDVVIRKK